ncbi:hypothetical protein GF337_04900, partial [candidate division KSB1 bacterium]|nr:hypothetical protein [candidate division KSB1 bacterium]
MNYGIIGVGGVFMNFQADALVRTPGLKLQALCDLNKDLLKTVSSKYSCEKT